MLICESDDGRATAWTRQNAGKGLNALKNSGEVTVVFSNRRSRRAEQDCAGDGCGAEQQSASANPERQIAIEALAMWRTLIVSDHM